MKYVCTYMPATKKSKLLNHKDSSGNLDDSHNRVTSKEYMHYYDTVAVERLVKVIV